MSDNVESVRTRIEAAFRKFGGEAKQHNQDAQASLRALAQEVQDIIGASNQAAADDVIKKLEALAKQYPGISSKLDEAHQDAVHVGQKM